MTRLSSCPPIDPVHPEGARIAASCPLSMAARRFRTEAVQGMLVVDESGRSLGVVSDRDLLAAFQAARPPDTPVGDLVQPTAAADGPDPPGKNAAARTVRDAMVTPVALVRPDALLIEVVDLLITGAPFVVVVSLGRPQGLLTRRDVAVLAGTGHRTTTATAAAVMAPISAIPSGMALVDAAERMFARQERYLAVVDRVGRLEGILSWERIIAEPASAGPVGAVGDGAHVSGDAAHAFVATVLNSLPDPVWLKDPNGVYLACNRAFESLFGAPVTEIIGKTDYDFVDPAQAAQFRAKDLEAIAAGVPTANEEWLSFADTGYRGVFETIKKPLIDGDGRLVGVVGIARDITTAARSRQAMQEQLALLDLLARIVAVAPGVICSFRRSPHGTVSFPYASPKIWDIWGAVPEALTEDASVIWSLIHPEDIDRVRHYVGEYPVGTVPQWQDQFRVRHPTKGELWVEGCFNGEIEPDGSVLWNGFLRDITERRRAEQVLEARVRLMEFASGHALPETLSAALDEVAALTASEFGFLCFAEPDGKLSLQAGSKAVPWIEAGLLVPIADEAWSQVRATQVGVVRNEPGPLPLRHRSGACLTADRQLLVPVLRSGRVAALLVLCQKETFYTEHDLITAATLVDFTWDIVERKQAAATIQDRETLYRAAIETSADGFWLIDLEGRLLEVNDAYVRRSGYSRSELLTLRMEQLIANHRSEIAARMASLRINGSALFESRHRAKDGSIWPVEVTVSYWPIADGRMFVFIRDLQRRQPLEALLRTRLQLVELANTTDLKGLIRGVCDATEVLTGSRVGFFHFIDPDQRTIRFQAWSTNTLQEMSRAGSSGNHFPIDQPAIWRDCVAAQTPVMHNDYAEQAVDAPIRRVLTVPVLRNQKVEAIIGVCNKPTDYTEDDVVVLQDLAMIAIDMMARKHAEERLRESEERYRVIVEGANEGLWTLDADFRITFVNPAILRMLGYTVGEMLGQLPNDFVFDEDRADHARRMANRRIGMGEQYERRWRRKDGSACWCLVSSCPLLNGDGKLVGVLALLTDITTRKQVEEELRASELRANLILETAPLAMLVIDGSGMVVRANRIAESLFGYEPGEMLSASVDSLVPPHLRAAHQSVRQAFEGRPTFRLLGKGRELWGYRKNGQSFPVEIGLGPVQIGGSTFVIVSVQDITARRQAENALRDSEAQLRLALSAADLGTWYHEFGTGLIRFDVRAVRHFGLDRDVVSTAEVLAQIHPADRPRLQQEMALCLDPTTGSGRCSIEYRVCHPDGTVRWLSIQGRADFEGEDAERRAVREIGTSRDITDQKEAQEQIRELVERISLATRAAGVGIWDFDPIADRLIWSEEMFQLYGVAPDQFGGRRADWLCRLHPDDRAQFDTMPSHLDGKREFSAEFRIIRDDGSLRDLKSYAIIDFDDSGLPVRLLGTNWDITDNRRALEELKVAKEHAEAANAAKSRFLASMSHELRTPLNAVIGFGDLLRGTETNPGRREHLQIICDAGSQLLRLIQDILDLSRIEAGKMTIEKVPFDLKQHLSTVCTLVGTESQRRKLKLVTRFAPDVPEVVIGDPTLLHQVLMNLVGNALKFTASGTVEIAVETQPSGFADLATVMFHVTDTGVGIKPENLDRIFEMFEQGDNSLTRSFGGSGLGLAIAKRLVSLMGGSIWVESVPGRGSRFSFTVIFERVDGQLLSDS